MEMAEFSLKVEKLLNTYRTLVAWEDEQRRSYQGLASLVEELREATTGLDSIFKERTRMMTGCSYRDLQWCAQAAFNDYFWAVHLELMKGLATSKEMDRFRQRARKNLGRSGRLYWTDPMPLLNGQPLTGFIARVESPARYSKRRVRKKFGKRQIELLQILLVSLLALDPEGARSQETIKRSLAISVGNCTRIRYRRR